MHEPRLSVTPTLQICVIVLSHISNIFRIWNFLLKSVNGSLQLRVNRSRQRKPLHRFSDRNHKEVLLNNAELIEILELRAPIRVD